MKLQSNTLDALLAENSRLAKQVKDRAGLAEIASLLLQLRHELRLSQKELAERAGLTKTMISELENSANDGVTLRTLVKIVRAVGGSLDLGLCLGANKPGTVSTSLNTGKFTVSSVKVAGSSSERDVQELAA